MTISLLQLRVFLVMLKNTESWAIYKPHANFILNGFVDADCAGNVNDRRSMIGYYFNISSTTIFWCSKK